MNDQILTQVRLTRAELLTLEVVAMSIACFEEIPVLTTIEKCVLIRAYEKLSIALGNLK